MRWLGLPMSALDIPFNNLFRSNLLRRLINQKQFDLIHVLELQHAGYLLLDTKLAPNLPKVFITNWGSDIYWFQQFPSHKKRIMQLLELASFYSAECQRDIEIVRTLGYKGKTMPIIPNSGGINIDEIPLNLLPPSQRKKIMIKGYTGFVGQALIALKACELAAENLRGYEVLIYSASIKSRIRTLKLRHIHKVNVKIIKKRTPHSQMLKHFSDARIYLGISLSDGISTSLLEAMATGCYPIQTDTSCANEWLHEKSGSLVSFKSINSITTALVNALLSNELVDQAAIYNMRKSLSDAVDSATSPIARSFYSQMN
jgi:glycosyltransferase involved in cell wall biosynthesis